MIAAISVTGKDRPGIIAVLTQAVYRSGGNLEDANMTILEGEFAMILLAHFETKSARLKCEDLLRKSEAKYGLSISVREIKHKMMRGEKHRPGTLPYLISVYGKDRSGIVYHVCHILSKMKLNITDLNSKIIGHGKKSGYALILEVDVNKGKFESLRKALAVAAKQLQVRVAINPIEAVSL